MDDIIKITCPGCKKTWNGFLEKRNKLSDRDWEVMTIPDKNPLMITGNACICPECGTKITINN